MANVERWEITVCPDCGQRVSGGYPVCTGDDKPHYAPDKTESVEVVRADAHRGAVEALRFYADESNWTARNPPGSGAPAWHDHGQRARDALVGR